MRAEPASSALLRPPQRRAAPGARAGGGPWAGGEAGGAGAGRPAGGRAAALGSASDCGAAGRCECHGEESLRGGLAEETPLPPGRPAAAPLRALLGPASPRVPILTSAFPGRHPGSAPLRVPARVPMRAPPLLGGAPSLAIPDSVSRVAKRGVSFLRISENRA